MGGGGGGGGGGSVDFVNLDMTVKLPFHESGVTSIVYFRFGDCPINWRIMLLVLRALNQTQIFDELIIGSVVNLASLAVASSS